MGSLFQQHRCGCPEEVRGSMPFSDALVCGLFAQGGFCLFWIWVDGCEMPHLKKQTSVSSGLVRKLGCQSCRKLLDEFCKTHPGMKTCSYFQAFLWKKAEWVLNFPGLLSLLVANGGRTSRASMRDLLQDLLFIVKNASQDSIQSCTHCAQEHRKPGVIVWARPFNNECTLRLVSGGGLSAPMLPGDLWEVAGLHVAKDHWRDSWENHTEEAKDQNV